jgi:hypothetical protein
MTAPRLPLTAARACELLKYDPETGVFTHITNRRGTGARVGKEAGYTTKGGYRLIGIDGRQYLAHRVALLMTHGEWPSALVDHINGDPGDNRIANLRAVDHAQNASNRGGVAGASMHPCGKWQAKIRWRGVERHLGLFSSKEEAADAYWKASAEVHGEYAARKENERDTRRQA